MHGEFGASPLETFGGLCDTVDGNDLPPYMAREAKNCLWKPGSVEKRPGFPEWCDVSVAPVIGLAQWASRVTTTNPTGRELVVFLSTGVLHRRKASGASIAGGAAGEALPGLAVVSAVQSYDRLFFTYSDGQRGLPFAKMMATQLSDLSSADFWPMFLEPPPVGLSVTVNAGAGSMTAGTHTFWATFELIDGSMTAPTPAVTVTVASNDAVTITFPAAPTFYYAQPENLGLAAIHLWGSPAGDTQNGYFIARVGAAELPYGWGQSDGVLTTAEKMDKAALNRTGAPLMPAVVCGPYKSRVFYVGSPHRYFPGGSAAGRTLNGTFTYNGGVGWGAPAAGGAFLTGVYRITFDGASAVRGLVTNTGSVINDLAGQYSPGGLTFSGARWGIRIVARRSSTLTSGSFRIGASSAGGYGGWQQDFSASVLGTNWTTIEHPAPGDVWGSDCKLFVQGVGPGVAGGTIDVALVEAYQPGSPVQDQTGWWSRPGAPREVDMTFGPVTVAPGTGQKLRYGFEMGNRWYYVLDGSLWVTEENGGEPSQWPLELVADGVGTPSFNGVAGGKDWKVIAGPEGCWLFTGAPLTEDANLAREIRELWKRIAWESYGYLVWVRVMESLRQVSIGVPLDSAAAVSHVLVLDYSEGFSAGLSSAGVGRRWSVWTVAPTGPALEFLDSTGLPAALLPVGSKVGRLTEGDYEDLGAGYAWAWESGPIGRGEAGLGLFRRLLFSAEGSGVLTPSLVKESGQVVTLRSMTLYQPRRGDFKNLFSVTDERVAVRFDQPASTSAWVRLSRAVLEWMPRPFAQVRPYNP